MLVVAYIIFLLPDRTSNIEKHTHAHTRITHDPSSPSPVLSKIHSQTYECTADRRRTRARSGWHIRAGARAASEWADWDIERWSAFACQCCHRWPWPMTNAPCVYHVRLIFSAHSLTDWLTGWLAGWLTLTIWTLSDYLFFYLIVCLTICPSIYSRP